MSDRAHFENVYRASRARAVQLGMTAADFDAGVLAEVGDGADPELWASTAMVVVSDLVLARRYRALRARACTKHRIGPVQFDQMCRDRARWHATRARRAEILPRDWVEGAKILTHLSTVALGL